jgi:hypothetical protein
MPYAVEWDSAKDERNRKEKGVSFDEAKSAVVQEGPALFQQQGEKGEIRHKITARNDKGRLLTVVYTLRPEAIRIISAWPASRQERREFALVEARTHAGRT